jgi:riboflavin kinase/FMN adenylyltransferase
MKREFGLDQIVRDDRSLVTVGTFDGVHLGHQSIIRYLVGRARQRDAVSVALSFDPHPREVLRGEPIPLLTTIEERARVFEDLGLDRFIVIPFTRDFAGMEADAFVIDVLVERIGLKEIVIGYDHGFGKGRAGDSELLHELGRQYGFTVDVIPAQVLEKDVVSSTRIRQALTDEGDVRLAARLLGRPYAVSGVVVEGDGRGRTIGYPTANITVDNPHKVIPERGVYAVRVLIESRVSVFDGMLNIGNRPTFDGGETRLEAHLFDYAGSLYGQAVTVEFYRRIRDEKKFSSVELLVQQLSRDKERCRAELESSD